MAELPLIGVTAVIAGMAIFNRDAAQVESRLLSINRVSGQLEAETAGAFGGTATAFGSMASSIATGATFISGALVLAGGLAVKFAADFQQEMALIAAATSDGSDESKKAISSLDSYITELARTGVVSLHDLAEGALELARSGTDIPEIMGGALRAVQLLTEASGGEISLKSAADLVANSMHAFGIEAKDAERITTAATVVAQNSTATYSGFGTAVAIAGASFQAAGFSIEDLAIAETILTRNGLNASTAATALRGVIQRLELPSKAAAAVMQEYGIHLFDAAGKGVGLRAVIGQLNQAFGEEAVQSGRVTEEQRATALATLGLQRTSVAMFALATQGTDAFDELTESFKRLRAEDIAKIVMEPLNQQAALAFTNIESLAKSFGDGFLPPLQAVTAQLVVFLQNIKTGDAKAFGIQVSEAAQAIVASIGKAIETINDMLRQFGLSVTLGDILKTTLVGLGVVILAVLVPPVLAVVAAFAQFLAIIAVVATAVKLIAGVVSETANAFANWVAQFGPIGDATSNVFKTISTGAQVVAQLLSGDFVGAAHSADLTFQLFLNTLRTNGGQALDAIGRGLDRLGSLWAPWAAQAGAAGALVNSALTGVHQVVEGLAFLLQGNFTAAMADFSAAAQTASGAFGQLAGILQTTALDALTKIKDGLADLASRWLPWMLQAGGFGDAVFNALSGVQNIVYALIHVLEGDFDKALTSVGRAGFSFSGVLVDIQAGATVVSGFFTGTLIPAVQSLANVLGAGIQTALDWVINVGWPALQSGAAQVGSAFNLLGIAAQSTIAKIADNKPFDDLKYAWGQLVEGGGHLVEVITNLGSILLEVITPIITIGSVVRNANGDVNAFATATSLLANLVHAATAELAIEATIFNLVAGAISGMISFIRSLIENIVSVTVVTATMLGSQDDLRAIWEKLQSIGSDLVHAFQVVTGALGAVGEATGTTTTAMDVFQGIAKVLGVVIGTTLAIAIKVVTTVVLAFVDSIVVAISILGNIASVIQGIIPTVQNFGSTVGTVFGAIIGFAGAVVNAFLNDWPIIGQLFDQLGTNISGALDSWLDSLNPWIDAVDAKIAEMAAAFQTTFDNIISTILGAISSAGAGARAIADAIVDGLIGGITSRAKEFAQAAANLASGALDAARNAVHAQSPSRDFELLGEDMGEGLDLGLLSKIPKVKDTAKTYGDTILAELADFTGKVETASRDIGDKLTDIATKAGDAQVKAINTMNHDIATAIDSTQDQLNRLGGALTDPKSNAAQERAIQDLIKAEKDAHAQQRQDDDSLYQHKKDLADADAQYKKNVDLENSKSSQAIAKENAKFENDLAATQTAAQRATLQQRHADALANQAQAHKDALANLAIRLADDKATADQRFADRTAEAARQRTIDQAERDFEKQEDAKITAFKEAQLVQERDSKIAAIQQAEQTNVANVQSSADQQRALLLRSYTGRIADLKDQLLDKIPPLTGAAADTLQAFMDNVEAETAATTQQITDAMGQTITTSVEDVGDAAHRTLGTGGVVPTAANFTTGAFNNTTSTVGGFGSKMGEVTTNQATQFVAVLLRLRDGLTGEGDYKGHGLIKAVNDLNEAINNLHDKTITITTNYVDSRGGGSSSSGGGGGGGGGGSSHPGESGPGGIYNNPATGQPYSFAEGGVVPGPWGKPLLAIVHGGEFVASLNSEAAKWARQAAMYQPIVQREYNYNVNASYANTQSPASVSMDMRALIALSRGS